MKTTVLAATTVCNASVLVFTQAHATPAFKSAGCETGWKHQNKHPGDHESRACVMNESAQWPATHVGPGSRCPEAKFIVATTTKVRR